MENSFNSIIDQAKSFLILLPVNTSFDNTAAGLALFLTLKNKANSSISSQKPMTVQFNRLIGVNRISQKVGNKNLVIKFSGYKADDIERVGYDIEDSQFRLTVVPKPGIAAPKENQVKFSYSGVVSDMVILVGGSEASHFPSILSKDVEGTKIIHLGTTSFTQDTDVKVISFAQPASSMSELIKNYIDDGSLSMDPDAATNLLMGIESAHGNLSDPSIGADTFQAVAELLRAGGKRTNRPAIHPGAFPPGAIPGQKVQQMPQQGFSGGYQQQSKQLSKTSQNQGQPPKSSAKSFGQAVQPGEKPTEEDIVGPTPEEWLKKPKIYKGGAQQVAQADSKKQLTPKPGQGVSFR